MNHVRQILSFGWPFLRRYWGRLVLGILLGICFGLVNASFVWGTKTLFERLEPAGKAEQSVPQSQVLPQAWEKGFQTLNNKMMTRLDVWLPRVGNPISIQQIIGGLLFLPVLVAMRSAIGYGSVYFLGWVSEYTV